MRGNLPGCRLPGLAFPLPETRIQPSHAHHVPSQVLEKKESLFQIPNQITARYAHFTRWGLSELQWHLIFFFL